MPEVSEQKNYDENLGISLDFNEESNLELDQGDDLLESSLTNIDPNVSTNTDGDDLFKTPEGLEDKTDKLDLNAEFEKLSKDDPNKASDSPGLQKTNKGQTTTKEDTTGEETSGSLTIAYAKSLQEQGLSDFNEEEYLKAVEEKGEAVAFYELLEKNAENIAQSKLKEVDEYTAEYTKLRQAGFSAEEAGTLMGNLEAVNSITNEQISENESLQEDIIREVGQLRGMSKDEVEEDIQLLKDTDKLSARATKGLKDLQGYYKKVAEQELNNKQQARLAQEENNKKYLNTLKDNIFSNNEIIKDKKINKQTQEKLYEMITKPIKQEDGTLTNAIWSKRKQDPIEFDKRLAYLIHTGLFDGETKTLTTDAKTNAIKNLEQTLSGSRKFSQGAPNIGEDKTLKDKLDVMNDLLED